MAGKNPEYEAKRFEGRVNEDDVPASIDRDRWEEVARAKDNLKTAGGEDVSSAGEKFESSHTGENFGRSPDTINAYRAREPRAESHDTVDTINAYRSTEPCAGSAGWPATEDEP
ncbi:MAG TPA: hypothetical protein VGG62_04505 [Terracidiphilus sp.]|jgi:hypothetical protein